MPVAAEAHRPAFLHAVAKLGALSRRHLLEVRPTSSALLGSRLQHSLREPVFVRKRNRIDFASAGGGTGHR
jgi:hypothetical protein